MRDRSLGSSAPKPEMDVQSDVELFPVTLDPAGVEHSRRPPLPGDSGRPGRRIRKSPNLVARITEMPHIHVACRYGGNQNLGHGDHSVSHVPPSASAGRSALLTARCRSDLPTLNDGETAVGDPRPPNGSETTRCPLPAANRL